MMYPILGTCPVCGEGLVVTRMECPQCATAIEGRFAMGRLNRLTAEQFAFAEMFIRCDGKLKHVGEEMGLSYPAVRARLDDVIRAMGYEVMRAYDDELPDNLSVSERRGVLESLERGEVSAEEALARLEGRYSRGE
jgi:hypothetical protein